MSSIAPAQCEFAQSTMPNLLPSGDGLSHICVAQTACMDGYGNVVLDNCALELVLLASATRTGTTYSAQQYTPSGKGLVVVVNLSAVTGTGSLTLALQKYDVASQQYITLLQFGSILTSIGTYTTMWYPGASTTGTMNSVAADVLPPTWRVFVTVVGYTNATFSVGGSVIL